MKGFLASLFMLATPLLYSQDYLDLMTVAYGRTPSTGYDDGMGQTTLSTLDLNVLLPIPLSERTALMTGVNGLVNRLELAPQDPETGLYTLALQAGINHDYGNGWTSTHLVFPRITSAFDQDRSAFQIGTAHLFQKKTAPLRSWGFGFYLNTEEQGLMLVPLFTYFYRAPGGLWEFNALLPSRADLNIRLLPKISGGLAFEGLGNSFAMDMEPYGKSYVQRSSNELGLYLQYALTRSFLFSIRGGYSFFRSFRVYDARDTVKFSFINIFFNDPRTPLNESIRDGAFFNFRIVYRFFLPGDEAPGNGG
jgi:hypothetical protein